MCIRDSLFISQQVLTYVSFPAGDFKEAFANQCFEFHIASRWWVTRVIVIKLIAKHKSDAGCVGILLKVFKTKFWLA